MKHFLVFQVILMLVFSNNIKSSKLVMFLNNSVIFLVIGSKYLHYLHSVYIF